MKFFSLILLLNIAFAATAQINFTVTLDGIGNLKPGMKKAEFEKVIGQAVILTKVLKANWNFDTVAVKVRDADFTLVFDRQYTDDKNYDVILRQVTSANPQLKTRSGITIGEDKYKIISTYESYTIWIIPDYENEYSSRSKTKTSIYLYGDDSGNVIIFHLFMNKIESISVAYNEAYD